MSSVPHTRNGYRKVFEVLSGHEIQSLRSQEGRLLIQVSSQCTCAEGNGFLCKGQSRDVLIAMDEKFLHLGNRPILD